MYVLHLWKGWRVTWKGSEHLECVDDYTVKFHLYIGDMNLEVSVMGTCGDALKISYECSSLLNMEFCLRLILNHINLTWGLWVTKFSTKVEFVADQPGLVESVSVQSNCALQCQL